MASRNGLRVSLRSYTTVYLFLPIGWGKHTSNNYDLLLCHKMVLDGLLHCIRLRLSLLTIIVRGKTNHSCLFPI